MAFDFTSGITIADSLEILSFAHNGKAGPIISPGSRTFTGGPVRGHLLAGVNPAPRTVVGNDWFYNQLTVPFDSLGTSVTFSIQLPEPLTAPSEMPDELAFLYFRGNGSTAFLTGDPLGTNALFAIDVTGAAGGDLNVFSPTSFIAPDTLAVDLSTVGVSPSMPRYGNRLRFRSVEPNPASAGILFIYEVPEPGGSLRVKVFDVAGRLIAEPFEGRRAAGVWTTRWDAANSEGYIAPAGVYMVQLQMAGQSLIRRVVLMR